MENQKIDYEELKEKIDIYLDRLNISKDVNENLNKGYLYEEIKDNIKLLKDEYRKKEELNLSENELIVRNDKFIFSVQVNDEESSKNIKVISAKKNTYNNRLIYLVKDTALISIDKETGEYSIKDNIRDVVQDMGKKYKINFDSFEAPLFISTSDHVTVANRIYFDVINYIEIDNNGNEIFNGYQELSDHKGYRKFFVNNDILGVESIRRIDKEEIEEKLLKEKDINIRKLLEKDYLENRDIFSYSKTTGLQKAKRR